MLNSMARSAKNVEMGTPWHQEFVETHPQVARMFDQVMEYVTNVNKVISNQDTDASKINLKMIAAMLADNSKCAYCKGGYNEAEGKCLLNKELNSGTGFDSFGGSSSGSFGESSHSTTTTTTTFTST